MDYLYESMIPSVLLAGFVGMLLVAFYVQSRKLVYLIATAICVPSILGLGWLMTSGETERERIEATIYDGAEACETNDLDQIYAFIEEDALGPQTLASAKLAFFTVSSVKVNRVESTINNSTSPPTAEVKLAIVARGTGKAEGMQVGPDQPLPFDITIRLRKHGDKWLVYECDPPQPKKF